jgi:hypothetical protein
MAVFPDAEDAVDGVLCVFQVLAWYSLRPFFGSSVFRAADGNKPLPLPTPFLIALSWDTQAKRPMFLAT